MAVQCMGRAGPLQGNDSADGTSNQLRHPTRSRPQPTGYCPAENCVPISLRVDCVLTETAHTTSDAPANHLSTPCRSPMWEARSLFPPPRTSFSHAVPARPQRERQRFSNCILVPRARPGIAQVAVPARESRRSRRSRQKPPSSRAGRVDALAERRHAAGGLARLGVLHAEEGLIASRGIGVGWVLRGKTGMCPTKGERVLGKSRETALRVSSAVRPTVCCGEKPPA